LQQCEEVSQAVVLAEDDKRGNKRLIGYIVPKDSFDKGTINKYLKEKLPDYMIPSVLLELESLPLTANGKINRKAFARILMQMICQAVIMLHRGMKQKQNLPQYGKKYWSWNR
jgi:acyl-CoA synthetase (AMP-forming)/AMP-acid ligase II